MDFESIGRQSDYFRYHVSLVRKKFRNVVDQDLPGFLQSAIRGQ